jgi:hypothetical protein
MSESIDRKFKIHAVNRATGVEHTDEDSVLLLAKDDAVPDTLMFYYHECKRLGADEGHLDSIQLLYERVQKFRSDNLDICKTPDMSELERPIQIDGKFPE